MMPDSEVPILQTEIERATRRERPLLRLVRDLLIIVVLAAALIVPVKYFVAQPFVVEGGSMVPLLQPHDYVIVDELTYLTHAPRRGDIVVFRYPLDPSLYFIKRLIGLPGETVELKEGVIHITPAGATESEPLYESYVAEAQQYAEDSRIELGANEYFMLGDNRKASFDSRVWGPVSSRNILGRAMVRVYPFASAQSLVQHADVLYTR